MQSRGEQRERAGLTALRTLQRGDSEGGDCGVVLLVHRCFPGGDDGKVRPGRGPEL